MAKFYTKDSNGNQVPKRSGATTSIYFPKTGANTGVEQHITNGWMIGANQFLSISAVTTKSTQLTEKGWYGSVFVTVLNKTTLSKSTYWGTMEKKTGKVVVEELSIVINPKAPNGGYCGTYLKK